MAVWDRLVLLPAVLLSIACGSAVVPEASDASTGMASSSTVDGSSSSESGESSTSNETSTTASGSSGDGSTGSSSTGRSSTGDAPAEVSICAYECEVDEDCLIGGSFFGLTCSDQGSCIAACDVDEQCIPVLSGWLAQPCTTNDECAGSVCVDFDQPDGTGGCAFVPSAKDTCPDVFPEHMSVLDIEGNPAIVCVGLAECTEVDDLGRVCIPTGDFGPNCERDGCPDGLLCRDDGFCGCDDDDACLLAEVGDTCFDGVCLDACDGPNDCDIQSPYDGGEFVCTPLE